MSDKYPRESSEFVVFEPVLVNGVPSVNFTWQITPQNERPTGTWAAPVAVGSDLGFLLVPATRGIYRVWVRIVAGGQSIVVLAGELERT